MRSLPHSLLLSVALSLLAACSPATEQTEPFPVALQFQVPTPGWEIELQSAYLVGDEIWCIHQLTSPDGMVAQVISEVNGTATLSLPADHSDPTPAFRHYILGKTWNWNPDESLVFLDSLDDIAATLESATPILIVAPAE